MPPLAGDGAKRLIADIDALEPESSTPEHNPPFGTVGEFAYSWFTQGADRARRDFADVATHIGLDRADVSLTSFASTERRPGAELLRKMRETVLPVAPAFDAASSRLMAPSAAMWGASLGASRAPARPRMPLALLDAVARARASCQECAEIMHDTFQMALDDGDVLHRSNADLPAASAAAPPRPVEWGVRAAPMPNFAMAMAAPTAFEDDEADLSFTHSYRIGASTLTLIPGDITRSAAEVYVSSDDDTLAMGSGVSRALLRASGDLLRSEADRAIAVERPSVGDVVVTAAPGLEARFVFHAVTLRNIRGRRQPVLIDGSIGAVVRHCVHRVFDLADTMRVRSIAFPVVAAGSARVPYADAMHEMADAIVSRLLISRSPIAVEVYLHDHYARRSDAELVGDFAAHVARRRELTLIHEGDSVRVRSWLEESEESPPSRVTRPTATSHPARPIGQALPEPRRLQTVARALVRLDNRRAELEAAHFAAIVGKEPSERGNLATLTRLLKTIRSRREALAALIDGAPTPHDPRAVFVSSTWNDLRDHRAAIRPALGSLGLEFVGMEEIVTTPSIPRDATLPHIGRVGAYLVIVGWRYGSVDLATGLSFTELEYVHAVGQGKPVLAFLMDDSVAVRASELDADSQGFEKLRSFREVLSLRHGAVKFTGPADLARKVARAFGQSPL
jgi:O-acetyl-ADP-ribose deacetylase (regulator of RNase III)